MRYFIDTEYDWSAAVGRIVPISIALISEDGREYYAATHLYTGECGYYARNHVIPVLGDVQQRSRDTISTEIREFIGGGTPEFWGDYAGFDYVVLSMLMGRFEDWPEGWPMFINDCQQVPGLDVPDSLTPHNALADARAIRDGYDHFWGW